MKQILDISFYDFDKKEIESLKQNKSYKSHYNFESECLLFKFSFVADNLRTRSEQYESVKYVKFSYQDNSYIYSLSITDFSQYFDDNILTDFVYYKGTLINEI